MSSVFQNINGLHINSYVSNLRDLLQTFGGLAPNGEHDLVHESYNHHSFQM